MPRQNRACPQPSFGMHSPHTPEVRFCHDAVTYQQPHNVAKTVVRETSSSQLAFDLNL